jgi:phage host-nuclease inhibitor protein Gam
MTTAQERLLQNRHQHLTGPNHNMTKVQPEQVPASSSGSDEPGVQLASIAIKDITELQEDVTDLKVFAKAAHDDIAMIHNGSIKQLEAEIKSIKKKIEALEDNVHSM